MKQRTKRDLKRAFIVTLGAAAALAATPGCDTEIATVNPPACPAEVPEQGDACDVIQNCSFGADNCGGETTATCDGATWEVSYGTTCNPPPAECPTEMPMIGSTCEPQDGAFDPYPRNCAFTTSTPCGDQEVVVSCTDEAMVGDSPIWAYDTAPTCEVPAEDCQMYGESNGCEADPGCSWRVPSCSATPDAPDVAAGCYPTADCVADPTVCGSWATCEARSYDPCWNSFCAACGAEGNVCVPNAG